MPSIISNNSVPRSFRNQNGTAAVRDLRVPLSSVCLDNLAPLKKDIIIFSDFDGTIFMQDTGHILFDAHGCGKDRREELDEEIKTGARSFRAVSEDMWGSLNVPFKEGFEVMKRTLEIDPDFKEFHNYCISRNIPFNVISAGLAPVLRAVLDEFLGSKQSKHIDIIANDATISTDGSEWKPVWRHECELGHDKAVSIKELRKAAAAQSSDGSCPLIVFVGDGVSDLPAAREADFLFARRGLRLEEYCIENKIPYIPFSTFAEIQTEIHRMVGNDHKEVKPQSALQYTTRPNGWRRTSSKTKLETLATISAVTKESVHISSKPLMTYSSASSISLC